MMRTRREIGDDACQGLVGKPYSSRSKTALSASTRSGFVANELRYLKDVAGSGARSPGRRGSLPISAAIAAAR